MNAMPFFLSCLLFFWEAQWEFQLLLIFFSLAKQQGTGYSHQSANSIHFRRFPIKFSHFLMIKKARVPDSSSS